MGELPSSDRGGRVLSLDRGELDADQRSRQRGVLAGRAGSDVDRTLVALHDLADDRQPESAAIDVGAEDPVETVEDAASLRLRNSGAGVLDVDERRVALAADAQRHAAALGRV